MKLTPNRLCKPDGTPRKLLDSSRIFSLGWKPKVDLESGIRVAYEDYLKQISAAEKQPAGLKL